MLKKKKKLSEGVRDSDSFSWLVSVSGERGSAWLRTHQTVSFTVGSGCQKDEATADLISSFYTDNINCSASQTSH